MVNLDEIKTEYPFKRNGFNINGNNMNYVDEGQGHPVIMLHGNPTWSFYYRNLGKALKDNYRVIIPDHIGCGLSDKPQDYEYTLENHIQNLGKLVKSLGITKFSLIVHDWGGAIGMGYATRHPENISNIIIQNTAAFRSQEIPFSIRICKTPILGEPFVRAFNGFAFPATFMASEKKLSSTIKKGYLLPYNNYRNRIATAKFVKDIPLSKNHRSYKTLEVIENNLNKMKCPIMVLWGKKDFCFNDHFLDRWKEIYPEAIYKEFKNAGHYVLEDGGNEILEDVKGFLSDN